MADSVGDDNSDFESVTSSQKSFLKNCPFANPGAFPTTSLDTNSTEVIENQISPAQTPIISLSSSTSLDSINIDVFRTPPENVSLSSSADSEPKVRVSEFKAREGASNLNSPSSTPQTTPISENVRVSEIKPREGASRLQSPSSTPKTTPVSENVRASEVKPRGGALKWKSLSSTPKKTLVSDNVVRVSETEPRGGASKLKSLSSTPKKTSVSENVRVLETKYLADSGLLMPLSSPPSVRVPVKQSDSDSASSSVIERALVLEKKPDSGSVAKTEVMESPDKVIKITEVDFGEPLPFKEIFEALLRNSGKNLNDKDEKLSCVDVLKQRGLKFP